MRRPVELEDLGGAGVYLLSDMSNGVTGEIHYVDCGYNAVGMPTRKQFEEILDKVFKNLSRKSYC